MAEQTCPENNNDVERSTLAQVVSINDNATLEETWQFWVITISLCLIVLTSALDGSIIAIALPQITNEIPDAAVQYISGGATSGSMLIAGRSNYGFGSGGIMLLVELIDCDIAPMRERGKYFGIVLSSTAVGAIIGPVLRYKKEPTWERALAWVDWFASSVFIASMCSPLLGLIMGGAVYPWILEGDSSIGGGHCAGQSLQQSNIHHRFFLVFNPSPLLQWVAFFISIDFQGVRNVSPIKSGINFLPFEAFLIPIAAVPGALLSKTGAYRPFHVIGFALTTVGVGLFTLLDRDTPKVAWVVFEAVEAIGQVLIEVATSVGMYSFLRSFGFVWGTTISDIIFNAQWDKRTIGLLEFHKCKKQCKTYNIITVYVETLKVLWCAAMTFSMVGFLTVFGEKHVALRKKDLDTEFGLTDAKAQEEK
ncbi:MFS general substrate transporter [Lentithecium fluviatile CBS 122367]|uniref:MFS general substrate transporter n=1 Tax=Lentithecium fluviatile CBS 122367 TaxID=1168545 RepID=A0A6G1IHW1_9PLEO|nr:MFS general substrate transporter [Lentithecium fluviatile CBS 122367]